MTNPAFLEKLLDGAKVEWKPLGEVLFRTKGTKITAKQMKNLNKDNAPLKIFAGGKTFAYLNFDDIPTKNINKKPSIIVKSRGIISFEYYDKPFSHKSEMWAYHSNDKSIHIKFAYHFLKLNELYFQNLASKMQMPQISITDTDKFKIPIPCPDDPKKSLAIQAEIVRILDKFTSLTTELTTELTARKKQYNYYREKLLTFSDDEVEWKPLGEVVSIITPPTKVKKEIYHTVGKFPIIDQGASFIAGYTDKNIKCLPIDEYVVFGDHSEHIKYIDFAFIQGADGLKILKSNLNSTKYIYYALKTFYKKELSYKRHWSVAKETIIPIPSLKEQHRIVAILDKFDTLTNSISEGLPKEIEQRQKQYEYYRKQLFNFPKPESMEQ